MKSFILGLTAASAVSASTSFLAPKVVNQVTAISNISDDLNATLLSGFSFNIATRASYLSGAAYCATDDI